MTTITHQPESRVLRNNNSFAKVPPHSVEAEQSVLGALMLGQRLVPMRDDLTSAQPVLIALLPRSAGGH